MSERAPILMHRRGRTLICHGPMDESALEGFDAGKPLRVRITQPRNIGRHRLYWAMVALIRDNMDNPPPQETLHDAFKVMLGLTQTVRLKGGETVTLPGSTAFDNMDEPAFREFLESFWTLVRTRIIPGLGRAEFERAALEMMGEAIS